MWAPKQLDIEWGDLAVACCQCVKPWAATPSNAGVAMDWIPPVEALVCLSVRSGWDLLLSALNLPRGSEVLVSAINIPHMGRIAERHGLEVVPVDVGANDFHPTAEAVAQRISTRTRLILVAHLFGSRADADEFDEIAHDARRNGILVVEDCAQAFMGRGYAGHDVADVVMFSFGPLKTATALGGAVLRVRNRELLVRMEAIQAEYPWQSRWAYLTRVCKYAVLKLLTTRLLYGLLVRTLHWMGQDHDRYLQGTTRGFPEQADLLTALRLRPGPPLMHVLRRRIERFDDHGLLVRAANGRLLMASLARGGASALAARPGDTYWVFPHRTRDKPALAARLLAAGFDVARNSSLVALQPTATHHPLPTAAQSLLESLVFLPAYKEMPTQEVERLADVVTAAQPRDAATDLDTTGTAA